MGDTYLKTLTVRDYVILKYIKRIPLKGIMHNLIKVNVHLLNFGGTVANWCSGRAGFPSVVGSNCKHLVRIRSLNAETVISMGRSLSPLCRYMYLYGTTLLSAIKALNF